MRIGKPAALLVQLTLLALAPSALADTSPEDKAAADALFSDAAKLAQDNRWAEACPKLEASIKLDPAIGAILRLAECYEKTGRTASAWTTLHDAFDLARKANDKRMKDAEERANRIEPTLAKLVLTVRADGQPTDLEVRRDGTVLGKGAWGVPVPLDPGEHVIEASANGRRAWKKAITIGAAPGVTTVEVPALVADRPGDVTLPSAPYWNGQRVAGVVLGGVGLAGIIVGSVFGVQTFNKNSASMPYCPHVPTLCYEPGVGLRNDAYSAAEISTIAFVAGGVTVAGGLIAFLTATTKPTTTTPTKTTGGLQGIEIQPIVDSRSGAVMFRGAW